MKKNQSEDITVAMDKYADPIVDVESENFRRHLRLAFIEGYQLGLTNAFNSIEATTDDE